MHTADFQRRVLPQYEGSDVPAHVGLSGARKQFWPIIRVRVRARVRVRVAVQELTVQELSGSPLLTSPTDSHGCQRERTQVRRVKFSALTTGPRLFFSKIHMILA